MKLLEMSNKIKSSILMRMNIYSTINTRETQSFLAILRPAKISRTIPLKTIIVANSMRKLKVSLRKITPASNAKHGTLNCKVLAVIRSRFFSKSYQSTYARLEVKAPEMTAKASPFQWIYRLGIRIKLNSRQIGTAQIKLL